MLRRSSWTGLLWLVVAVGVLFVPLAAASDTDRAIETLTVLTLTCALAGYALVWLVLRQRGYVRLLHLGLGSLCGAYVVVLLLGVIADFAEASRQALSVRLLIV